MLAESAKDSSKAFPCSFLVDVLCPCKRNKRFAVLSRCFECEHYKRFIREMEEEEREAMDEIDEVRRTRIRKNERR